MLLRLNDQDPAPLYQQIAAAVRRALTDGELTAGDRLPPARSLATSLGVNMHTVLRSYAELEREGLVRMRRGRGVSVTDQAPDRARLWELARELTREAHRLGVVRRELIDMLGELP